MKVRTRRHRGSAGRALFPRAACGIAPAASGRGVARGLRPRTDPWLSPRLGFTLIEVVVAMAILAVITVSTWVAFDGVVKMRDTVERTEATTNAARVVLQRATRELSMAFLTRHPSPTQAYGTVFLGTDEGPTDRLLFNTFSHIRLYRNSTEGDTTELTWYTEPDPDNPGLFVLLHREAPRIDGVADQGGVVEVLARRVREFNLRYYDSFKAGSNNDEADEDAWIDEWDTLSLDQERRLPRAVEVNLVLVDLDEEEHAYTTVVLLPMFGTTPAQNGGIEDPRR